MTNRSDVDRHDLADTKGRTPADRVAVIQRGGPWPITDVHREAATALLVSLLDAAATHGVTLDDLDWVTDLPGACLDVVLHQRRRA